MSVRWEGAVGVWVSVAQGLDWRFGDVRGLRASIAVASARSGCQFSPGEIQKISIERGS